MGWETRQRGGRYYTRSKRVRGRVVREYVGGGEAGVFAAILDAEEREDRLAQREARRKQLQELDEADEVLGDLYEAVETITRAALYASGFHRHKQGEWRRRRGEDKQGG